jgi:uncharacterized protein YegP (UPF0339 family)
MATATKKARAGKRLPRTSESPAMELLVFQDNGGRYRWALVAAKDEQLAHSPSFATYEEARDAAGRVRDGAGSARLDGPPIDLTARREAAASDDAATERWLDEGGGYTAAVAAQVTTGDERSIR